MDGTFILIAALVGIALGAGLFANRYVRPFAKSEVQGVKLEALVGPIVSITVLLIAFTLVQVFGSYQRAEMSAADEARKVDYLYEMANYLDEPERQALSAATVCYALAVSNYEWPAMAETGGTAREVSPWTAAMREQYALMVDSEAPSSVQGQIFVADRDRGELRSKRLTEARPAIPTEMKVLLLFTASVGIFALATFTLPNVRRRVQVGVLCTLGLVFVLFLTVMNDMDSPFSGLVRVVPTDITRVSGDLSEDFAEDFPGAPLPCDETGKALA